MWRSQSKKLVPWVRSLAPLLAAVMVASPVQARPVPDLYVAQVPTTALSGAPLDDAFDRALTEVLVRVTGRLTVAADPASRKAVGPAAPLVAQYQPVSGGLVRVRFDASALRRRLDAAALPVWADDRPLTLVVLPADGPATDPDLALQTAAVRGVPLVLGTPTADPVSMPDPGAVARGTGADLLLAGERLPASGIASFRWTLVQGDDRTQWQGDIADGINGLADRLAARYATAAAAGSVLRLRVEGVDSFEGYGRLQSYLKSVGVIQAADLVEVSGSTLVFGLTVRGGPAQLQDALALQRTLAPAGADAASASDGTELLYRLVSTGP